MKKFAVLSLFLVLILVAAGCVLFPEYGSLSGYVFDEATQEPIVNARVIIGTMETFTDEWGDFYFDEIEVGEYEITVEAPDFDIFKDWVYIHEGDTNYITVPMMRELATVAGYVVEGRGGSPVAGADVIYGEAFTVTDINGYFEFAVSTDTIGDILVTAPGSATSKVQDVKAHPCMPELEIPLRPAFSPNMSYEPPTLSVDIMPGQVLTGSVEINMEVMGNNETFVFYAYLGSEARYPNDGFEIYSDTGIFLINTTWHPNGETFMKFLAYDNNGNATMLYVPVIIDNVQDDFEVPSDLQALEIESYTWGTNIVFYGDKVKDIMDQSNFDIHNDEIEIPVGVQSAPDGSCLYNRIFWTIDISETAIIADGYAIYRSFDGFDYQWIGNVTALFQDATGRVYGRYDDWSAQLRPNQETYYKVVPYNSFGMANPMERSVTPMPAYSVLLDTPGNGATGVGINPTFTWIMDWSEPFIPGLVTHEITIIDIWDATDYLVWEELATGGSYTLDGFALNLAGVYSWDIWASFVQNVCSDDEFGYSIATSAAGEYTSNGYGTGSANGEYIFTTTTGN